MTTNSGRSGRGPTRLMSPRKMFHSWGNSSMCSFRSTRPTRVTRGSLGRLHWMPDCFSQLWVMLRIL